MKVFILWAVGLSLIGYWLFSPRTTGIFELRRSGRGAGVAIMRL